jgi:hypothetical protein
MVVKQQSIVKVKLQPFSMGGITKSNKYESTTA